jgi:cytochrome c oxidase subunit 2
VAGIVLIVSACSGPDRLNLDSVSGDLPQNALDPAGPEARKIDNLWWLVFWIATAIFVVVEAALLFTVFRFRRRKGADHEVKQVHGNTRLEIVWTIIPAVLLAVVAVPTIATLFDLRAEPDASENALQIEVIGHQWWWEFHYPEYGFTTANEMHIPAGRPVLLTMTSADVIHSFWTPQLNGKRDVVPGRTSTLTLEADEPGLYLGQCAEFCGLAHADMRHRVFAETPADFEAWAQAQAQPAVLADSGPAAAGWETFQIVCASCHAIDGTSANAQFGPNLTHFASRSTFGGATFENTTEHLADWLENPSALKPMRPEYNDLAAGRVLGMPNLDLTEAQISDLIALLETLE